MKRRELLTAGGRAALGVSLLPLAPCSAGAQLFATPADRAPWETLLADLEKQIPGLMADAKTPGLSIAIIRDAKVLWRRGFGVRDSASKEPVDNDTVFEACSVSKTVFAYAVMKLSERRVLNLDTPLSAYTADRWLKDDPRFDQITARHVLSHTSGLQNWRSKDDPLRIHFTPGSQWLYSGEGYSFLQSIVTRLTGRDIDTYTRSNIFDPFGMTSSGYVWNDAYADRYAAPHDGKGNIVPQSHPTAAEAARYGSAGGLFTTATEYAQFFAEIVNPRPADAFRLTSGSRDEMVRPQVRVDDGSSWALGWRIVHGKGGDLITHGGDNGIQIIGKLTNGATPLNALVSGA